MGILGSRGLVIDLLTKYYRCIFMFMVTFCVSGYYLVSYRGDHNFVTITFLFLIKGVKRKTYTIA